MNSPDVRRSLTPELIQRLLNKDARAEMSTDYVRLMEIYCVVKAGGAAAQIAVAKQLQEAEESAMLSEIETLADQIEMGGRVRALKQELRDLEYAMTSRISYLQGIDSREETIVRGCIPIIDDYFSNLTQSA